MVDRDEIKQSLRNTIARGRRLRRDVADLVEPLLETVVGKEGLSRVLQPTFPGVRTYAIEVRPGLERSAIVFTLVGVARSGEPIMRGRRVIGRGRDGSLEIHHGEDHVDPKYRSRAIFADGILRELTLLEALARGTAPRLTTDATGVGRYLCALHAFDFADQTPEGPPIHSALPRQRSDAEVLREQARVFAARLAEHHHLPASALERCRAAIDAARRPCDFAALELSGVELPPVPEPEDVVARPFGRAFLLADDTAPWRGALYLEDRDGSAFAIGDAYRTRQARRAEIRLAFEIDEALRQVGSTQRTTRIKALEQLGATATAAVSPTLRPLCTDRDRRVAGVAKETLRMISNASLPDRLLGFGQDDKNPTEARALALRILAEYFPQKIEPLQSMLRVHPEARVQNAIVPLILEGPDPGPELGAMLRANPVEESRREGLAALRLELIEALSLIKDPRTLPALLGSLDDEPPPDELRALSRALLHFPDPRARAALATVPNHERPQIP